MLRIFYLLTLCWLLTACASTCIETKEVVELEPCIYTVYAHANNHFGNQWNTSRDIAISKANAFCERKGKRALVTHMKKTYRTDITFRCLSGDDPALQKSVKN